MLEDDKMEIEIPRTYCHSYHDHKHDYHDDHHFMIIIIIIPQIPQTYCHSFKEAVDGEGKDDEGGSKVGDGGAFILPFLLCIWT